MDGQRQRRIASRCPRSRKSLNGTQRSLLRSLSVKKIPSKLQVHPKYWRCAEELCQAQCGVCRNTLPLIHNVAHTTGWYVDKGGESCSRNSQWHKKFLIQDFSRMSWGSVGRYPNGKSHFHSRLTTSTPQTFVIELLLRFEPCKNMFQAGTRQCAILSNVHRRSSTC